jgi:hypothetical protein
MEQTRIFKAKVDLPYIHKDCEYLVEDETGFIYMCQNEKALEYPLRQEISGYIWLLLTENKYFEQVKS